MDSLRPGLVVTLMAEHFTFSRRVLRGLLRGFAIGGAAFVIENFLLLVIPVPHIHLCTLPLTLVLGPIISFLTFRNRVELAAAEIPCPRCAEKVNVPDRASGWPARFNCPHCAIMIELRPAGA